MLLALLALALIAVVLATPLAIRRLEQWRADRPERPQRGAAHGSGCTHSSALAAHLALGFEPLDAARAAKQIASEAVRDGLRSVGAGPGPVDVFGGKGRERRRPWPA